VIDLPKFRHISVSIHFQSAERLFYNLGKVRKAVPARSSNLVGPDFVAHAAKKNESASVHKRPPAVFFNGYQDNTTDVEIKINTLFSPSSKSSRCAGGEWPHGSYSGVYLG
jgi:hypothetical protein